MVSVPGRINVPGPFTLVYLPDKEIVIAENISNNQKFYPTFETLLFQMKQVSCILLYEMSSQKKHTSKRKSSVPRTL